MSYCRLPSASALDRKYHDEEWGIPVHDDRKQFECLMLEAMQCGLSWELMLKKREIFRSCFDNFDYDKISVYGKEDIDRIMNTPGMIRSLPKIKAVIGNAQCFKKIQEEYGSFCNYLWGYVNHKTIIYKEHAAGNIPAGNHLSEKISKDLKKRGFKYIGPVTMYSHLQACGIINDHDPDCPCYQKIVKEYPFVFRDED